ncbi:unnamed protein product, partial [Brachionus calyciflorus]
FNLRDSTMRDFCNVAERDCIRLIVAQDLKESGIDVDSSNLGNFSSNMTQMNTSYTHNQSHHQSNRTNFLSINKNILNTSSSNSNYLNSSSTNYKLANNTTGQSDMILNHDSQPGRVFGVELRNLEMATINLNEQILTIPTFLKFAIEYLNDFTHVEGVFRRNGTASRLKELKKQSEEGVYNFSQFAIFDLTSLVKLFFRELPESLLTFSLYSNFIKAVKLESTNSKLESILNLCLQLPDINLHVLIYLMHFLKKITINESLNKMNSFNLAVCFAPNIIYTRINKSNELYINEERIIVQLLIENSSLIGKVSDSVYERSIMLNSLCCSTSINPNCSNANTTKNLGSNSNDTNNNTFNANSNGANNDMMFLYDQDLQENSSFAHHVQSVGSTSLSSYCGSSSNKKEKKKRRSSSLKELMNTIQNSISKFRRRSASEKNDKTTYSIITCTSMTSASSSTNCGDLTSCSNRYDDKQKLLDTPFLSGMQSSKQLANQLCSNFYATPRINKRNAEDSLQSTTKKKLMEKLPNRNLLLPNAPITPFSTSKKSKHPFKQLLSGSDAPANSLLPNPTNLNSSNRNGSDLKNQGNSSGDKNQVQQTPMILNQKQIIQQTPSTLTKELLSQSANPGLHKQLKYEDSPSMLINQSCDLASFKPKYQHEKNMSLTNDLSHECRRRLDMLPSGQCRSHHHHHHHHHHQYSSSSSSSHKHSKEHHHHHHSERKKQHQYVNAIPSNALSHRSNRYINQSDLCTQIISGNLNSKSNSDQNLQSNECLLSFSSNSSSSSSGSQSLPKVGGSISICTATLQQNSADNSMRCTLRRGRPNTPKTGLSVDYRIRKSSVPNTPECKSIPCQRANNTISNDDMMKSKKVINSVSSVSLNTAMVLDNDDDENADKISIVTNANVKDDDLNDARILDIAFTGDDEELPDEDYDCEENICDAKIEDNLDDDDSMEKSPKLSKSLSLTNLNTDKEKLDLCNQTSISESVNKLLRKKSLSADVLLNDSVDNESHIEIIKNPESELEIKMNNSQTVVKNPIIEEQQKLIHFEPFEFKQSNFTELLDQESKKNENMLQACLRRQSLFKLKETINGKVSKQVTEIEQRKLSPYRFSNSPLRMRKFKDSSSSLSSGRISKSSISPIRVPSIFSKKILRDTPREHYILKNDSKDTNSPILGKSSDAIFRKMSKNRSVKRLNLVSNQVSSNLSSIAENENASLLDESKKNTSQIQTSNVPKIGSPVGKNLILSKELICSTESIDL